MRTVSPVITLVLALLAPVATGAQPLPTGAPFAVNASAAGNQTRPDVAADGADNFRFVWQTTAGDPVHQDVRIRRLLASGSLGADSALAESTTGDQVAPSIAMTDSGDWAAIWISDHVAGERPYGRLTTSGGTILGAEFAYSPGFDGPVNPAVAVTGEDYFVGAWLGSDGGEAVRGNFRSRAGATWGVSEIGPASPSSLRASVAGLHDDRWVAAWDALDAGVQRVNVRCHRLDDPTEAASLADATGALDQEHPDVASNGASRFVVVWHAVSVIYARLFRYDGLDGCEPISARIQVSATGQPALYPRVDMASDGAFVVVWYENTFDSDNGIAAREFTKNGTAAGPPYPVHPATAGAQASPSVAISASTFTVVWTTPDGGGPDRDIQARTFWRQVVFSDDFESGDVTAWSATVP